MRIHVARADPGSPTCAPTFIDRLRTQRAPRHHEAVADPAEADVILFPDCHLLGRDWRLTAIAHHDLVRRYPAKVAVYDERDRPWCRFPGIYVSMPSDTFAPTAQVAGSYYRIDDPAERLGTPPGAIDQDLLFSFVGGRTHPCRDAVFALTDPRAVIGDSTGFLFFDPASSRFEERRREFAEVLFRSKFALCPRGTGTSSIRLYETMAAGRAPVVIADAWRPPAGPDWEQCSIRWPESRTAELPAYLARREPDATAMGLAARAAYEQWFAPDVVLSHFFDQLEGLRGADGFTGCPDGGYRGTQYRRVAGEQVLSRLRAAKARILASSPPPPGAPVRPGRPGRPGASRPRHR
jgi:hypothetical protein